MTNAWLPAELADVELRLDGWLAELAAAHDHIAAVERDPDHPRRWYVRMTGEEKDYITVWLTLGQRTLRYETYVMPSPEENSESLYENLLRRNERLTGVHFSIGVEDAVSLRGEIPVGWISHDEVDRILGTLYATVEISFPGLLRIGFANRFR